MYAFVIIILILAAVAVLLLLSKYKTHVKILPEAMERSSIKEFEEANAVTPLQQRWLAFGAPVAYGFKESSRVFKMLPDEYDNAKDPQILKDAINESWTFENETEALELLDDCINCKLHSPNAKEIYIKFIANHQRRYEPEFGKYLLENFYVTGEEIEDLKDLKESYESAKQKTADRADWHLIAEDITDEEEIEKVIEKFAREGLLAIITGGVKSYGDVLRYLTSTATENHRHPFEETFFINNFCAYDLANAVFLARACAIVDYISEEEAWDYIQKAAETASRVYSNWHEYIAAYLLGGALTHGKINSGSNASKLNAYLIGHKNSPLKEVGFKP